VTRETDRRHLCLLSDGYDVEVFEHALAREPALRAAAERAGRLLPRAAPLLCDLFCALFKLNVVVRPAGELPASALVNRRLIEAVAASGRLEELRRRTQLDELQAGAAAVVLADHVLSALTRDSRVTAQELVDLAATAHDEAALEAREREREHLGELEPGDFADPSTVDRLQAALGREIEALRRRLEGGRESQEALATSLSREIERELSWKVGLLDQQLGEMDSLMDGLGVGRGAGGAGGVKVSAQARLELGRQLLKSRKLQLLARLCGAMREVAFEARRRRVSRAPQELHQVQTGAELERLLPSELLGLPRRRGGLHLDFLRRFSEAQLLQYQLHGAAERGPIVICVDGSGSMHGSKELWAKAVALTLMEIARRERRRCLAIVFSSGGPPFEVDLLARTTGRGGRAAVRDEDVLRFAEHYPGGGTSFEEPLSRAIDAVSAGEYRRGDIVFITDGEAPVSDDLVARVERERKRHRFRIRGIEVDVRDSRADTLSRFCDDVRKVSDLTADSIADVFAAV
jgi:uncharacterized protein with von Willebrand factor type A (vWA) domain